MIVAFRSAKGRSFEESDRRQSQQSCFVRPKVRHLNVATFRQNVGILSVTPALWRGAATSHFSPREIYHGTARKVFVWCDPRVLLVTLTWTDSSAHRAVESPD